MTTLGNPFIATSTPSLTVAQVQEEAPAIVSLRHKLPSRPLDQWSKTVMGNMKRMATDEDYRKSIAQKLS